jgi:pSer/pThr/pTyr-binding forkhead associated (FHA) protein
LSFISTTGIIVVVLIVALGVVGFIVWRMQATKTAAPGTLEFLSGPRAGELIELAQGRVRIGALADNDIVIPAKEVSRYHAELRIRDRRVQIWDLQSRNETLVNGASIKTSELNSGDVISIAGVELRYDA